MESWSEGTRGLVVLPDGRRLRGRGLRHGWPDGSERPQLGVYLTAKPHREDGWESIWVRWPDFRLPHSRSEAVRVLRRVHDQTATRRVELACGGGIGRTGTAVAILARLSGVPAAEAVAWTRRHYHPRAVETPWQRRFVARVDLDVS
ncbi:protein-tyrosine phosphatase family protein [Microlunatus parietis]|uniref:Protein-tyrosine phosphatase n=1 Tax=Microlunatus parietis TaxID=682979 RepID=A0A7Y9I881_9ACTN|nr:protein-tyrosine phosphatase family protein [Microlunatus parietis]NYE72022.1 protein-tyrosine phosphatase [Microlunatus parietis]